MPEENAGVPDNPNARLSSIETPEELTDACRRARQTDPELPHDGEDGQLTVRSVGDFSALPPPRPDQVPALGLNLVTPTRATATTLRPTLPPPVVPGYEILGVLGRGGMGVVYKARQTNLDRIVALKMIIAGCHAKPEYLARFRTEAEAVASLQHPHVVQIFDIGEHGGSPYISLEFAEGGSLAQRLNATPLPARQAAALLETLARTLHAAHQRGILHRDLKPGNILLQIKPQTREPRAEEEDNKADAAYEFRISDFTPKIADFGLAKKLDAGPGQTGSGHVMGTPSYMAPEQATGKKEIGPTVDVYALGAVLYELLTGRPPFRAETSVDTMFQVIHEQPVSPRRLQPKLPRDLETICLKCLEKEPRKRYSSAGELAAELERFLAHEPIHARPTGPIHRLGRWCKRKPVPASLLLALCLALGGGVTGVVSQWLRAEEGQARARRKQLESEERLRQAKQAVDEFFTLVSEDLLLKEPSLKPLRKKLLERALGYYRRFLEGHDEDEVLKAELAAAYTRVGQITTDIGSKAEARAVYQQARALYTQLVAENPEDRRLLVAQAKTCTSLARLLTDTGEWAEAQSLAEQMLRLLEPSVGQPEDLEVRIQLVRTYNVLARIYTDIDKQGAALKSYEQARAHLEELIRDRPEDPKFQNQLAATCNGIGNARRQLGRASQALPEYENALRILEQLCKQHPAVTDFQFDLARSAHNLAIVYMETDQPARALLLFKRSREILEELVRKDSEAEMPHVLLAKTYHAVGVMEGEAGQLDDALVAHQKAVVILNRLVAKNQSVAWVRSELGTVYCDLASIHQAMNQMKEALRALQEAVRIQEELVTQSQGLSQFQRELATSYDTLGDVNYDSNQLSAALDWHSKARKIWEQLVPQHGEAALFQLGLCSCQEKLGRVLHKLKRTAEARSEFEHARQVCRRLMDDNPNSIEYKNEMAAILLGMGEMLHEANAFEAALDLYSHASAFQRKLLEKNANNTRYRSQMGALMSSTGQALVSLGRCEEAVGPFQQAISHQREAVRMAPRAVEYRTRLAGHYSDLARLHRLLRHPAEAAEAALARQKLAPDDPSELYLGACELSLTAALVTSDNPRWSGAKQEDQRRYADQAMDSLRRAIKAGYNDVNRLQDDPNLAVLRLREDFKLITDPLLARGRKEGQ
jgi:serine/threonine protein kinase/tetratricopeptide (TPR) repeat protein